MELLLLLADIPFFALVAFGVLAFPLAVFPNDNGNLPKASTKTVSWTLFSFRNMIDSVVFQIVLLSTGMMLDLIGLSGMGLVFGIISLSLTATFLFYSKKRKSLCMHINMWNTVVV